MAATKYYIFPFGENADDLTAIPNDAPIDGSVSYFAGWTDLYELDLNTEPTALPIPRGQMNQLFLDITANIQQYQQFGTPNWISDADNGGVPFPYPIYARVYYLDSKVYENQVAANTAVPGTDNTWLLISQNTQGVPTGAFLDMGRYTTPVGYLYCDGSAVSRSTYAALFSAITNTQNGTTTTTSPIITGLTSTAALYAGMPVEGTGIQAGSLILTIDSGTQVTLTLAATASATVPVRFIPWGNGNGTTTFNVPDGRRRMMMQSGGGSTSQLGNALGQKGGAETFTLDTTQMPPHHHNAPGAQQFLTTGTGLLYGNGGLGAQLSGVTTDTGGTLGVAQPYNVINPAMIVYRFIKT